MKQQLTPTAEKLLAYLIKTDGAWKDNCMEAIFQKPGYISTEATAQAAYWQWEADAYGAAVNRPVAGQSVDFIPANNYSSLTSAAYQELRKAGLAGERNNGCNEYWLFPITANALKYTRN